MKDSTRKLINDLIKETIDDIKDITDSKDKAASKMELIKVLADISEKIN